MQICNSAVSGVRRACLVSKEPSSCVYCAQAKKICKKCSTEHGTATTRLPAKTLRLFVQNFRGHETHFKMTEQTIRKNLWNRFFNLDLWAEIFTFARALFRVKFQKLTLTRKYGLWHTSLYQNFTLSPNLASKSTCDQRGTSWNTCLVPKLTFGITLGCGTQYYTKISRWARICRQNQRGTNMEQAGTRIWHQNWQLASL